MKSNIHIRCMAARHGADDTLLFMVQLGAGSGSRALDDVYDDHTNARRCV